MTTFKSSVFSSESFPNVAENVNVFKQGRFERGLERFCSDTMETHTFSQQAVRFAALPCTQESGTKLGRFVLSFALSFFCLLFWLQQAVRCVMEKGVEGSKVN